MSRGTRDEMDAALDALLSEGDSGNEGGSDDDDSSGRP